MLSDLVLVEWEDIVAHSGWTAKEGHNTLPALIHTVGVITHDTGVYLTISSTWGPPDSPSEYNQHITIPKGCIKKCSPLQVTQW